MNQEKQLISGVNSVVSRPALMEFASQCASQPGLYVDTGDREILASRIAGEIGEAKGEFALSLNAKGGLNGLACLKASEFDSAIFGMKMGAISHLFAGGTPAEQAMLLNELLSRVMQHAREAGFSHLMARASSSSHHTVHALEQHGFRTMGVQVALAMKSPADVSPNQPVPNVAIRPFKEADLPFLQELSAEAYMESRFFADPHLSPEAARELHRLWIANDCHGRAAQVLVADLNGAPAGYIACLLHHTDAHDGSQIGDIDLLAVSPKARGKGVASELVRAAIHWLKPHAAHFTVRTQVTNYRAIALYQRAGFQLARAHTTLHANL